MKVLLDTHIWIWSVLEPKKLSGTVRRLLERSGTEAFLSPVSIWEAHCLHQRGKLRTRMLFQHWVEDSLRSAPVRMIALDLAVAMEASRLVLPQPDFGDVMLAATAVVNDLTLVTSDAQLLQCKWLKTVANH